MAAALSGVLAYLAFGLLGLIGRPRLFSLLALAAGVATFSLWAPGFPEVLVGGLPWGIAVAGDPWTLGMWALGLTLHGAVLLHGRARKEEFHPLITLLIGTCLAGALSRDLFNLFVLMDLSSLLATILVVWERRERAVWAAFRYLVLTEVGLILYLMGLGLVYARTGTLSITALAQLGLGFSEPILAVGAGLLVAGTAVKTGVFLLGLWLPPAHDQAPTEVSAVLSGLVVKVGVVALARLSEAFPLGPILVILGALTGFGGIAYALWEKDIKIFLAHHTASQLGYMLLGLGLGMELGALLYAVAHGLFKGLLFLAAGSGVVQTGKREIKELAGRLSWPVAVGLGVGTWAIAGLPPLAGFAAKGFLSQGAPFWAKAVFSGLGIGTAASFSKLIPLLRPIGTGPVGGLAVLVAGVMGLGLGAFFFVPELREPRAVAEAALVAGVGYALHWPLRRWPLRFPELGLDRSLVSLLFGTLGIAILALFLR